MNKDDYFCCWGLYKKTTLLVGNKLFSCLRKTYDQVTIFEIWLNKLAIGLVSVP